MRTALFLASGFLLLGGTLILARLFAQNVPSVATGSVVAFGLVWLAVTGANMWIGVNRAGYSVGEELPIFLLLFAVPVLAAALARWRLF
ncbi:MAG: hypothetical protein U1F41_02895 [Burkholderiales bacterium]